MSVGRRDRRRSGPVSCVRRAWPVSLAPVVVLAASAACASGRGRPDAAAGPPEPRAGRVEGGTTGADPIAIFGLRLGTEMRELVASVPGLGLAAPRDRPEVLEGRVVAEVAGLPTAVTVSLYRERLRMVSIHEEGEGATLDRYRSLVRELERALGRGYATRCGPEGGPGLEAGGAGMLSVEWETREVRAGVEIGRGEGPGEAASVRAWVTDASRPLPCPPDLVCGEQREPPPPVEEVLGRPGSSGKEAEDCRQIVAASPQASFLGLSFGSSRAEAERVLGVAPDAGQASGREDILETRSRVAGADADIWLYFHGGCLAELVVRVEGEAATTRTFEALRQLARPALGGPGESSTCESTDGIAMDRYVGLGFGSRQTVWPDTVRLQGSLRFERSTERPVGAAVVLELEYVPLRGLGPRYDFDR